MQIPPSYLSASSTSPYFLLRRRLHRSLRKPPPSTPSLYMQAAAAISNSVSALVDSCFCFVCRVPCFCFLSHFSDFDMSETSLFGRKADLRDGANLVVNLTSASKPSPSFIVTDATARMRRILTAIPLARRSRRRNYVFWARNYTGREDDTLTAADGPSFRAAYKVTVRKGHKLGRRCSHRLIAFLRRHIQLNLPSELLAERGRDPHPRCLVPRRRTRTCCGRDDFVTVFFAAFEALLRRTRLFARPSLPCAPQPKLACRS